MTTANSALVGIIGAGNIGSNVARAALAAGYNVVIANSRGPESLEDLVAELGPEAQAATVEDAAVTADWIVVAIPLGRIGELPPEPFAHKVVLDANNYYPQRDGHIAALDSQEKTSSQILQDHLPDAQVVKAFNTIQAAQIATDGSLPGTDNRRALPIAGDDEAAVGLAGSFIDALGFDTVTIGTLAESWKIEPGTPAYGPRVNADQLREITANVTRAKQS